jgi:hypothetical protein
VGETGVIEATRDVGSAFPATTLICSSSNWNSNCRSAPDTIGMPSAEMVSTEMVRCQPPPVPRLSTAVQLLDPEAGPVVEHRAA